MTDQQISMIINVLRYAEQITPLQKDIIDTWDTLQKRPFDAEAARKQILSNNVNHPNLLAAITVIPDVIQKPFSAVTQEDMVFNLRR